MRDIARRIAVGRMDRTRAVGVTGPCGYWEYCQPCGEVLMVKLLGKPGPIPLTSTRQPTKVIGGRRRDKVLL
jgi:hypothetical protein